MQPSQVLDGMGIERYWTYQSFQLTDRVTLLVNLWNGNLVAQYNEFSIPSLGLSLALNRTFNHQVNLNSLSGYNWTRNLDYRVVEGQNTAIVYDPDGTQLLFTNPSQGVYVPPPGVFDTLKGAVGGSGTFTITHKDQSQHIFGLNNNGTWLLTKTQDRVGNAITLTYDGSFRVITATAAGGQALGFNYDVQSGKLLTVTNSAAQKFTYQYAVDDLTAVTDPFNFTTGFTYTNYALTRVTDPRTVQTIITYDGSNRVQTITIGGTQVATFAYGAGTTTFTDGNSRATTYTINSTGQVTQMLDPLNGTTLYAYDANYDVTQVTDPLNRVSKSKYDTVGNVTILTDTLSNETRYTYNSTNDLLSVTDPLSRTTGYGYDAVGNLQVITDALGFTTNYGYNSLGQRTSATDANGNATTYQYTPGGYLITITDTLQNITRYTYDTVGNRTAVIDALTNVTTFNYDADNRLTATTIPLTGTQTATTRYGYDSVGNRTVITTATPVGASAGPRSVTNPATDITDDASTGNVAWTNPQNAGVSDATYATAALGAPAASHYLKALNFGFAIPSNASITGIKVEIEKSATVANTIIDWSVQLVKGGVVQSQNKATGVAWPMTDTYTTYGGENDLWGLSLTPADVNAANFGVVMKALNGGSIAAIAQVDHIRMTIYYTQGGTYLFTYDALNRQTAVTDPLNHTTSYGYDAVGNRTVITDANSHVTGYGYDALNRTVAITDALSNVTRHGYDAVGNRTVITDALTNTTTYGYDALNRVISTTVPLTGTQVGTTLYGYDKVGNRTVITDALDHPTTFLYDNANRLIQTTDALGNTTLYGYDRVGNRTVITDALAVAGPNNVATVNDIVDDASSGGTIAWMNPGNARLSDNSYATATNTLTVVPSHYLKALNFGFAIPAGAAITGIKVEIEKSTTAANGAVDLWMQLVKAGVLDGDTRRHEGYWPTIDSYHTYGGPNDLWNLSLTPADVNAANFGVVLGIFFASENITAQVDHIRMTVYYTTSGAPQTHLFTYDALNRVITTTNPLGKKQTFGYDAVGNRLSFTDELTQTTRYAYDKARRVVAVTDPLTQTTTYGYDVVGNTLAITSPTGLVTAFVYDGANRVTSKTTPIGATQYAYDNANNLITVTSPSLATQGFTYDAINRVTQEDDRDSSTALIVSYLYGYDPNSNRTSETERRTGNPDRVTSYTFDKANRLSTTTDPNSNTTTYAYDAVGNQTGVTDPGGYTTSVTPNAVNLPITTTLLAPNQSVLATTTSTYDARNILQSVTTVDTPNSLTLTNTLTYNSNSYLVTDNIGHQGNPFSASLTSTVTYQDSNLVRFIYGQGSGTREVVYDSASRVICSAIGQPHDAYLVYDGSGHRLVRYWNEYGNPPCSQIIANPDGNALYKRATYTYDGNRLIAVDARGCQWGVCNPNTFYSRTLAYDAEGNLTQVNSIGYAGGVVTTTLSYGWETDTHRMTSVTRYVNGSVTYTATLGYDRQNRTRQFCTGTGGCSIFAYVGSSDWLAYIIDQYGNVTQRYFYANGRPLRVDFGSPQDYYRYNWHGDVAAGVLKNGDGAVTWTNYGAWGDLYDAFPQQYYNWNGGWGYMKFPNEFNFNQNEGLDIGLYYVHGRWYNQDNGLYLSPDEKGSYIYLDNDPVNKHVKPRGVCSSQLQTEPSDCEKFVDEVQRFISIAQAAGAGDDLTVKLLAQYYSGIPATWQIGSFTVPSISGFFAPGWTAQVPPFPEIGDRWLSQGEKVHLPLDSQEGQEARRKYGFKRIFFDNTHHYFAVFYQAWFRGAHPTRWFSQWREREQNNATTNRQPYDEGVADIAVGEVAIMHAERINQLSFYGYSAVRGGSTAIRLLPQLLAQDACGKSDQEIYAGWPPADIEKILGPRSPK